MTDEKKPPQEVAATPTYAAVDVMQDRLELGFYTFGSSTESHQVMHISVFGDPAQAKVWGQLWELLQCSGIRAAAIDSGGLQPQQVYKFVRQHGSPLRSHGLNVFAIKCQLATHESAVLRSMLVDVFDQGHTAASQIELLLVPVKQNRQNMGLGDYARAAYEWSISQPCAC